MQFEPAVRDAGDQTVRDIVVQAIGSGGKNVKITLWPEFAHVTVSLGDFIVAQGKFTDDNVNGKQYLNLSANKLHVASPQTQTEGDAEVTNALDEEEALLF